ncbi:MAG: C1 family peptidase [Bacteroidota bacterium]|nr:C1 family peptidase [Bacteroidota bacterium]
MKKIYYFFILSILFVVIGSNAFSQVERKDKAIFIEPKNEFMDSVKKSLDKFYKKDTPPKKSFKMDFSTIKAPATVDEFKKYWHTNPISQANTNTCWCFCTTSFFESEIYRLTKREIKLSEMFTIYHEYIEKARRFIREHGNSAFAEGSESNAVVRMWKMYGIVPAEAYSGMQPGQPFYDHSKMYEELNKYLQSVKTSGAWNEDETISTVKSIMNHHMGEPPKTVTVDGKQMSPKEYLEKVVKLNLDDYIDIMSLMEKPYYEFVEYEVPDNWWHSKDYYNVPLDEWMKSIKGAIRNGFTVCIGGDVSEAGIEGHAGVAVVPSFDIPASYIDENSRQFRFSNGTTGDDHGIHMVGYTEKEGKDWYLIKDSGSGSRNNTHPGYYFYNEDYVKLKMLSFMVHKDAVREIIKLGK